ncbi:MAG TPA: hypothetical protein VNN08_16935 [Thermoanaerobaculia bacterium]|nr:hypothetical protein [Thermoanaerobaculia bacterium]
MQRLFCAIALTVALTIAASAHATDWSSDLDLLRRELPKMHPNAFHAMTRDGFDAMIERLKTDAPSLPHAHLTPPASPGA